MAALLPNLPRFGRPRTLFWIAALFGSAPVAMSILPVPGFFILLASALSLVLGVCLLAFSLYLNLSGPHWRETALGYLSLLLCPAGLYLAFQVRERQRVASIVVGDTIIAAIERFHTDTGNYPEELSMLVPKYLPDVPQTKMRFGRNEFDYRGGTTLGFQYFPWKNSMCFYRDGQWEKLKQ